MNIQIEMDAQGVLNMLGALPREIVPVAASRALNKTAQSAKSVAVKSVAHDIGIAQKEVRPFIQLRKATRLMLDAVLWVASNKRLPLIKIDPRAKQGLVGVTYRGAGGLRRTIPHAFMATMPSGHRGIYAKKPGAGRLPIRELCGPSLSCVFKKPQVQQVIESTVRLRWPVCCEQEVNFLLQKGRFK